MTMTVHVNDEPLQLPDATLLGELLRQRQPRPPFAVEVNKRLVRRTEYEQLRLSPGDRVEVVTLVGGG